MGAYVVFALALLVGYALGGLLAMRQGGQRVDITNLKRALLEVAIICQQSSCFDCPFADHIGCMINRPLHWRIISLFGGVHECD